jgi:hypothetical protein
MTASPGREVDANLLRCAAPGSAKAGAEPQDAGGQDLGDLVETLGRGHEVGVEGVGQPKCTPGSVQPQRAYQMIKYLPGQTCHERSRA